MNVSITQKTSTANTTKASGRTISYIVVHYTAGTSSKAGQAASTAAYFAKSSTKASADFIVDDATIVQFNPDIENRYTWHCGGSKLSTKGGSLYGKATNKNSIGVEICSTNSTGKVLSANDSSWSFSAAALSKASELVSYLMATYGIDSDHVIRHYDVTGKLCPGIVGWNADSGSESAWKAWKAGLSAGSAGTSEAAAESATVTSSKTVTASQAAKSKNSSLAGTYTVTASSGLNVRGGAGTGYSVLATIPKGTTVTCYGYYTTVSGTKWLYVQFTYGGVTYTGFASSTYLKAA